MRGYAEVKKPAKKNLSFICKNHLPVFLSFNVENVFILDNKNKQNRTIFGFQSTGFVYGTMVIVYIER